MLLEKNFREQESNYLNILSYSLLFKKKEQQNLIDF